MKPFFTADGEELPQSINLLGIRLDPTNMRQVHSCIEEMVASEEKGYLAVVAIHSILDCQRSENIKRAFNGAILTAPDGMPLVWIAKLLGYKSVERIYGPELLESVCDSPRFAGYRHFFLGGAAGVAAKLVQRLQQINPKLQVVGTASPELTLEEGDRSTEAVTESINAANPDLIWVALGSGKQEGWIATNRDRIEAPVLIGVGAAFDFLAGTKAQAPDWVRKVGLEWLFRLTTEPRRLWRRYAEYPRFFWLLGLQILGFREFQMIGTKKDGYS